MMFSKTFTIVTRGKRVLLSIDELPLFQNESEFESSLFLDWNETLRVLNTALVLPTD